MKKQTSNELLIDTMSADDFFDGATNLGDLLTKAKAALKNLKELNEQFGPETIVKQEFDVTGSINLEFYVKKTSN